MKIGASNTRADSGVVRRTVCQPGASCNGMTVSITPPRSGITVWRLPSISTVTGVSETGTLVNERHPRMLSSRRRCLRSARLPGLGSLASTTRPRMRPQVGAP